MALLAFCVLVDPATAQDEADADTIWVDGDKTIIVMSEDGRRVVIRSADGEEGSRFFFEDRPGARVFGVRPGTFFDEEGTPRIMRFHSDRLGDLDEDLTVLDDMISGMDGVWVDRLGDDLRVEFGASMKERSELMRMETESQRLARRARRAEGQEKADLERELEEQLNEIFDRKQALQEERIDRLRDEMDKALDRHNERDQHREEIIERRLRQLLGRQDRLDW
jgi:hypothetical protein